MRKIKKMIFMFGGGQIYYIERKGNYGCFWHVLPI